MKLFMHFFFALFFILAGANCSGDNITDSPQEDENIPVDNHEIVGEPVEIIDTIATQYVSSKYTIKFDTLYAIQSLEELERLIPDDIESLKTTTGHFVKDIDFEKYTLIMGTYSPYVLPEYSFFKIENNSYTYLFECVLVEIDCDCPYFHGIIVNKLPDSPTIVCIEKNTNFLTGTWRDYLDNSLYTFSDNDTLYIDFSPDSSIKGWKWTYHFISEDSIQIERLTESKTNPYTRKTNNRVFFYSNDSILIENFYPSDATVFPPEFVNITLLKQNN